MVARPKPEAKAEDTKDAAVSETQVSGPSPAKVEEVASDARRDKVAEALRDSPTSQCQTPKQTESQARKDMVRDAMVKKSR